MVMSAGMSAGMSTVMSARMSAGMDNMEMVLDLVVSLCDEFVLELLDIHLYSKLVCVNRHFRDMLPAAVVSSRQWVALGAGLARKSIPVDPRRFISHLINTQPVLDLVMIPGRLQVQFSMGCLMSSVDPIGAVSRIPPDAQSYTMDDGSFYRLSPVLPLFQHLHVRAGVFTRKRMRALRRIHRVFIETLMYCPVMAIMRHTSIRTDPVVARAWDSICANFAVSFCWVSGLGCEFDDRLDAFVRNIDIVCEALDNNDDVSSLPLFPLKAYRAEMAAILDVYLQGLNASHSLTSSFVDDDFRRQALTDVAIVTRSTYRWLYCVPLPCIPRCIVVGDVHDAGKFDTENWCKVSRTVLAFLRREMVLFTEEYKRSWYLIRLTKHVLSANL